MLAPEDRKRKPAAGATRGRMQEGPTRRAGRPLIPLRPNGQLLRAAALARFDATSWRSFATIAGSLDVMSVRQPPSMFTVSRVSLPLAIAPRTVLHSGHSLARSPAEVSD